MSLAYSGSHPLRLESAKREMSKIFKFSSGESTREPLQNLDTQPGYILLHWLKLNQPKCWSFFRGDDVQQPEKRNVEGACLIDCCSGG